MNSDILHSIFIINYLYLAIILCRQGFGNYWAYILQLLLATALSVLALCILPANTLLLFFCGGCFFAIGILPMVLSRWILNFLPTKNVRKICRYARWRYWLTHAKVHYWEYLIFRCWLSISQKKYQQALDVLKKLQEGPYALWARQLSIMAYNGLGQWPSSCEIGRRYICERISPFSPHALSCLVEAFCNTGDFASAISTLATLHMHPNLQHYQEELAYAELCVHAHMGNIGEIDRLLDEHPQLTSDYWYGVAYLYSGNREQAYNYLQQALQRPHIVNENNIRQKLTLLADNLERLPAPAVIELYRNHTYITKDNATDIPKSKTVERPWVTQALIAANIMFFIALELMGGSENPLLLHNFGANSFAFVFERSEYWRLATSLFLHFGYLHLLMNMFGLYLLGSFIENFYSKSRFIIIYALSGLAASVTSVYWHADNPFALSIGASGAICGLMGACLYFFLFCGNKLPDGLRRHYLFSFAYMIGALVFVGQVVPQIDDAAHFGGLGVGFITAFLVDESKFENRFVVLRTMLYRLLLLFIFLFTVWSGISLLQSLSYW